MSQYFPFNPRNLRRGFWLLGLLGGLPLAQAIRAALQGEGFPAFVRSGMCSGLVVASIWVALRLRPRAGWGVTLHSSGILLGRAGVGKPLELSWREVELEASRGRKEGHLVLHDPRGNRVVISERLFAHRADFSALFEALEQHLPRPPGNA